MSTVPISGSGFTQFVLKYGRVLHPTYHPLRWMREGTPNSPNPHQTFQTTHLPPSIGRGLPLGSVATVTMKVGDVKLPT